MSAGQVHQDGEADGETLLWAVSHSFTFLPNLQSSTVTTHVF